MSWVRLDDRFPEHPKVAGLSDAAFALYVRALTYANRNSTGGLIPQGALWLLCKSSRRRAAAQELVAAGLWELAQGGWRIHDYEHYQPVAGHPQPRMPVISAADRVEEIRRKRSEAGRLGAVRRWAGDGKVPSASDGTPMANATVANGKPMALANGTDGNVPSAAEPSGSKLPEGPIPIPIPDLPEPSVSVPEASMPSQAPAGAREHTHAGPDGKHVGPDGKHGPRRAGPAPSAAEPSGMSPEARTILAALRSHRVFVDAEASDRTAPPGGLARLAESLEGQRIHAAGSVEIVTTAVRDAARDAAVDAASSGAPPSLHHIGRLLGRYVSTALTRRTAGPAVRTHGGSTSPRPTPPHQRAWKQAEPIQLTEADLEGV